MRPTSYRSVSTPIILGAISVALSITVLVGWILVVVQNLSFTKEVAPNVWLLVLGIVFLVVITTVLVLLSVFLVREIQESRKQISFIDSVTHELKSPLASLSLCLQTLERPEPNQEQRLRLHHMMRHDVERLATFIDDILEANRVGHGRRSQAIEAVAVEALVSRCAAQIQRRHGLSPDSIELHLPASLSILTDSTALETVLKNLLDNAAKYTKGPPRIHVKVTSTAEDVVFEVRDEGMGIDRHHLARIFERFYRVPGEEVRARRGTGLGLYVVRALVHNLGGTLRVQSPGVGKGATFTVRIPQQPLDAELSEEIRLR